MGVYVRKRKLKDGKIKKYYYVRNVVEGKMKYKAVGPVGLVTKSVAQVVDGDIKKKIMQGRHDEILAEIPKFSEYTEEFYNYSKDIKKIRSHRTTKNCLYNFSKYYGAKKLSEISPNDIDDFKLKRIGEGVKPISINRDLSVVKALFNYGWRNKRFYGRNPVTLAGLIPTESMRERILTFAEEGKLIENSPPYLKDIIKIALNTGMRQGEILSLLWDWVDLENNIILLPQTHTKSKKQRLIPINSVVRSILLERKIKWAVSEFVFPNSSDYSKHLKEVKKSFKTACRLSGITGLTFHDLRHTCATRLVEANIPLHAVTKLLGHSSVKVTERYSHPDESVNKAVEVLAQLDENRGKSVTISVTMEELKDEQ